MFNLDALRSNRNTIYNAANKLRRQRLNGGTPIEALMAEITKLGFYYEVDLIYSKINGLVIALNKSLELAKEFPSVLILDCTYKTKK